MEWAAVNSVAELENELKDAYRRLRDLFHPRFPEVFTVQLTPLQLARVVLAVGEAASLDQVSFEYCSLESAQLLALKMVATTSKGTIENTDMKECILIATRIVEMWEEREKMTSFVSERLSSVAPNMCALVGPDISARLLAQVGSVKQLAACPANNLQVIGKDKSRPLSFGYIADCDLVHVVPDDQLMEYKKNAVRLIAAKLALAVRADFLQSHSDGSLGRTLRLEITKKLEKLTEPLPYKIDKPLPPPIVQSRKRRGGKRARKLKEQTAMTSVRRQQNRLAFGTAAEDEVVVGDSVVGKGMLDPSARITSVDSKLRERVKKQSERALTGIYAPRTEQSNPFAFDAQTALLLKK